MFPEPVEGLVERPVERLRGLEKPQGKKFFRSLSLSKGRKLKIGLYGKKMEGYLYILRCNDGSFYVGSTIDIEKRLVEHRSGLGAEYTRRHLPVELVYLRRFRTIESAFREERRLHGWSHAKKQALIDGDFELLQKLAASHAKEEKL